MLISPLDSESCSCRVSRPYLCTDGGFLSPVAHAWGPKAGKRRPGVEGGVSLNALPWRTPPCPEGHFRKASVACFGTEPRDKLCRSVFSLQLVEFLMCLSCGICCRSIFSGFRGRNPCFLGHQHGSRRSGLGAKPCFMPYMGGPTDLSNRCCVAYVSTGYVGILSARWMRASN